MSTAPDTKQAASPPELRKILGVLRAIQFAVTVIALAVVYIALNVYELDRVLGAVFR